MSNNLVLHGVYLPMFREYFDSEVALENFASNYLINASFNRSTLEYIGDYDGKSDVIKLSLDNKDTYYYSIVDDTFHEVCMSINGVKSAWHTEYSNLRGEYFALVNRGVKFKNSHYKNELQRNRTKISS